MQCEVSRKLRKEEKQKVSRHGNASPVQGKKKIKRSVRVIRDSLTKQNTEWGRNCGATSVFRSFGVIFQIKCRMAVETLEQTTQNNRNSFSRNPQLYNLIARKYH